MAELVEKKDGSVMLQLTGVERAGLSNVINHALHADFSIDERDCHSLTGLEWSELQALWALLSKHQLCPKGSA
jgi:hypothetical protein